MATLEAAFETAMSVPTYASNHVLPASCHARPKHCGGGLGHSCARRKSRPVFVRGEGITTGRQSLITLNPIGVDERRKVSSVCSLGALHSTLHNGGFHHQVSTPPPVSPSCSPCERATDTPPSPTLPTSLFLRLPHTRNGHPLAFFLDDHLRPRHSWRLPRPLLSRPPLSPPRRRLRRRRPSLVRCPRP